MYCYNCSKVLYCSGAEILYHIYCVRAINIGCLSEFKESANGSTSQFGTASSEPPATPSGSQSEGTQKNNSKTIKGAFYTEGVASPAALTMLIVIVP